MSRNRAIIASTALVLGAAIAGSFLVSIRNATDSANSERSTNVAPSPATKPVAVTPKADSSAPLTRHAVGQPTLLENESPIDEVPGAVDSSTEISDDDLRGSFRHVVLPSMEWLEAGKDEIFTNIYDSPNDRYRAALEIVLENGGTFGRIVVFDHSQRAREIVVPDGFISDVAWNQESNKLLYLNQYRDPADRQNKNFELTAGARAQLFAIHQYDMESGTDLEVIVLDKPVYDFQFKNDGTVLVAAMDVPAQVRLYEISQSLDVNYRDYEVGDTEDVTILPVSETLWYTHRILGDGIILDWSIWSVKIYGDDKSPQLYMRDAGLCAWDTAERQLLYFKPTDTHTTYAVLDKDTGRSLDLNPTSEFPRPIGFSYDGSCLFLEGSRTGFVSKSEFYSGKLWRHLGIFEMNIDAFRAQAGTESKTLTTP